MIKAQGVDERMLERLHAQGMETYSRDAEPKDYEAGKFGEILGMVRRGASFEEVRSWYEGVKAQHEAPPVVGRITKDLYGVFVKLAKGETADFSVYGKERERASGKVGEKRRRMLEMAAMGFTNAEIAEATGAALSTVKECVGGAMTMQRGREAVMSRIDEVRSLVARMVMDKIKYRQGRYELDDLVQEGVLGVLMYADHYDPDKGTLGTFVYACAYRWIIQRVFVCGQYARRRINNETLSLNRHVGHRRVCGHGDDNEVELMDLIPSECDVEHDATVQAEADRVFEVAQEVLKDKPLYVLRRLYSDDEPTYRQVGEELGCSHQRVEQLKTIALRGVKVALRVNEKP